MKPHSNLIHNNKAISTPIIAGIILIGIIIIAALVLGGGAPQTVQETGIQVSFDGIAQSWNQTVAQPLYWSSIAPSMSYTKNVSVTNRQTQGVTLIMQTTEPAGSTLSWPKNNTYLPVNQTAYADLTLTTSAFPTAGEYTWKLIASNSTATPTPSPTSSGTPTPERFNCTIIAGTTGVQFITVTYINRPGSGITIPVDMLPYKLPFTSGDTLKIETTPLAGYLFNAYQFSDGTAPQNTPIVTLTATDEFTITAILILDPTP